MQIFFLYFLIMLVHIFSSWWRADLLSLYLLCKLRHSQMISWALMTLRLVSRGAKRLFINWLICTSHLCISSKLRNALFILEVSHLLILNLSFFKNFFKVYLWLKLLSAILINENWSQNLLIKLSEIIWASPFLTTSMSIYTSHVTDSTITNCWFIINQNVIWNSC